MVRMYQIYLGVLLRVKPAKEVLELIKDAIEFHIEGLVEAGEPVPPPSSVGELIEVNAA